MILYYDTILNDTDKTKINNYLIINDNLIR
jgi:hypothetical protein